MEETEIKRSKHQKPTSKIFNECNLPECSSFNLSVCKKEDFNQCAYFKALQAAHTMKID